MHAMIRIAPTAAYPTRTHAHLAVATHIHGFFNPARRHSALCYVPPDNYAMTLKAA